MTKKGEDLEMFFQRRNLAETAAYMSPSSKSPISINTAGKYNTDELLMERDNQHLNSTINNLIRSHKDMNSRLERIESAFTELATMMKSIQQKQDLINRKLDSQVAEQQEFQQFLKNYEALPPFDYFKRWVQEKIDRIDLEQAKLDRDLKEKVSDTHKELEKEYLNMLKLWDLTRDDVHKALSASSSSDNRVALLRNTPIFNTLDHELSIIQQKAFGNPASLWEASTTLGMEIGDSPDGEGVLIQSVREFGAASIAGLSRGDVILCVDTTRVKDQIEFRRILDGLSYRSVSLTVMPHGSSKPIYVTMVVNKDLRGKAKPQSMTTFQYPPPSKSPKTPTSQRNSPVPSSR